MSALRPIVRGTVNRMSAARSQCRNSSHGHGGPPADYVPPSMNELPTPQGSWQAKFNADQKKYNMTLLAGVGVFAGTILTMKATGFTFHYYPPESCE